MSGITGVYSYQNILVNQFTSALGEHLDVKKYPEQINQLSEIGKTLRILHAKNLEQLDSAIQGLKDQIIPLLVSLERIHLDTLEVKTAQMQKPKSFDNLFEIARLHQEADRLKITPRNQEIGELIPQLIDYEQYDKAIEMSLLHPHPHFFLGEISKKYLEKGDIAFALKVSQMILSERENSVAIYNVTVHLVKRGEVAEAISLIPLILDLRQKASSIAYICRKLLELKRMDEAIDLAKTIVDQEPNLSEQRKVLVQICGMLDDNIEKKLEVATLIKTTWARLEIYRNLFEKLTQQGRSDEAIRYSSLIIPRDERESCFEAIALALTTRGESKKAIDLVNQKIINPFNRDNTIEMIAEAMKKSGQTPQTLWDQLMTFFTNSKM